MSESGDALKDASTAGGATAVYVPDSPNAGTGGSDAARNNTVQLLIKSRIDSLVGDALSSMASGSRLTRRNMRDRDSSQMSSGTSQRSSHTSSRSAGSSRTGASTGTRVASGPDSKSPLTSSSHRALAENATSRDPGRQVSIDVHDHHQLLLANGVSG